MKFSANAGEIKQAWATVSAAVPSRPSHPILGGVLVSAKNNRLTFQGFDLSLGIETNCSAQVEETGSAVFPCARVAGFLSALASTATIDCDATENRMVFKSGKLRFECPKLGTVEDFPKIFSVVCNNPIELSSQNFAALSAAIGSCLTCASTEESKQVLTGVRLDSGGVIATNGHILNTKELGIVVGDMTIAPKHAALLAKLKGNATLLHDESGLLSVVTPTMTLVCRLLDGPYPDVRKLFPAQNCQTVVPVAEMRDLINRMSIVESGFTVLNFTKDGLRTSSESESGKVEDFLPIDWPGDPLEVAFSTKYLKLIFGQFSGESEVSWQLTGPTGVSVLYSPDASHKLLIMPLQIRKE